MTTIKICDKTEYQVIEGFGAFGGLVANWEGPPYYNEEFLDLILNDLGLNVSRNEYYPPSTKKETQDSSWEKQESFLKALKAASLKNGKEVKFIVSLWSPPAHMKTNKSTKNGGNLLPKFYDKFAEYLLEIPERYKNIGIDLYALSIQNEPQFGQYYNSCLYTKEQYKDTILTVGPALKKAYPKLKIFGQEHMLWHLGEYNAKTFRDPNASKYIDRLAVHGYSCADEALDITKAESLWLKAKAKANVWDKPLWMTETSNYGPGWNGCINAAISLLIALKHGQISMWVWWQLSESGLSPYSLMQNGVPKNLYYAFKHFYRFISPGSLMVQCDSDRSNLMCVAFKHNIKKSLTIIAINTAYNEITDVEIEVKNISKFKGYVSSKRSFFQEIGLKERFSIPSRSIITLQEDKFYA